MLTGVRPWEGDSAASVALARLSGPIPDPAAVRPSIPPDLASITRKALALDPNDRWPSAAAMADALEATLQPGGGARPARRQARLQERPVWPPGRRWSPRPPVRTRAGSHTPPTPTSAPIGEPGEAPTPPPPPLTGAPPADDDETDEPAGVGRRRRRDPAPRGGRVPRLPARVRGGTRGRAGRRAEPRRLDSDNGGPEADGPRSDPDADRRGRRPTSPKARS